MTLRPASRRAGTGCRFVFSPASSRALVLTSCVSFGLRRRHATRLSHRGRKEFPPRGSITRLTVRLLRNAVLAAASIWREALGCRSVARFFPVPSLAFHFFPERSRGTSRSEVAGRAHFSLRRPPDVHLRFFCFPSGRVRKVPQETLLAIHSNNRKPRRLMNGNRRDARTPFSFSLRMRKRKRQTQGGRLMDAAIVFGIDDLIGEREKSDCSSHRCRIE